jgi:hypothetical protein
VSFLAPLFLIGAAALVAPLVFHLIRRTTRARTLFSSLMFLRAAPPRLTRRNRLEDLWLLLLRCGVLGLLALGFARPFWRGPMAAEGEGWVPRRVVLLLDTSASMRRPGLWDAASHRAEARVRALSAGDELALWTFDRTTREWIGFEEWRATSVGDRLGLLHSRLAQMAPGWLGTHLDTALTEAAERVAEGAGADPGIRRQVVVISDLGEGSRTSGLQAHEWPGEVGVLFELLKPREPGNAGLQGLVARGERDRGLEPVLRVRVENGGDSKAEQFEVGWGGAGGLVGPPIPVHVPAGQSRVVSLSAAPAGVKVDRVLLRGDAQEFDNEWFVVPPAPARLRILFLGSESESDTGGQLFYLRRAFPELARMATEVVAHDPAGGEFMDLGSWSLVVVGGAVGERTGRGLGKAVEEGATVLWVPPDGAAAAGLARWLGWPELGWEEVRPVRQAMLGELDFRHPLLDPFADSRFSDFTRIHFDRYRRVRVDELFGARVVARYDTGDPAWFEVPVGLGRWVVLTSGWRPSDSRLALSSKFVPLLHTLVEYAGARVAPLAGVTAGSSWVAPAGAAVWWVRPDGEEERLEQGPGSGVGTLLTRPGIYRWAGPEGEGRLAVNLEPTESRTTALVVEDFALLGVPLGEGASVGIRDGQRRAELSRAEIEGRQRLWRWFLGVTLVVLMFETWLAGRAARRSGMRGHEVMS